jgi:hypothetical protein
MTFPPKNPKIDEREFFNTIDRLLLLAILQDDRQLYGVERLFDSHQFENFELAVSASSSHSQLMPTLEKLIRFT